MGKIGIHKFFIIPSIIINVDQYNNKCELLYVNMLNKLQPLVAFLL